MINRQTKTDLLKLSRDTLSHYFVCAKKYEIKKNNRLLKTAFFDAATFVTLSKNGELRGCVGNIIAKNPLYKDVINNSLLAAFGDSRFPPLSYDEIGEIEIEISVLSEPKILHHKDKNDLLQKIRPNADGVILQTDHGQSTFLPQVWEDLFDKVKFFEALSKKAGLIKDAWKNKNTEIFTYQVENFSE